MGRCKRVSRLEWFQFYRSDEVTYLKIDRQKLLKLVKSDYVKLLPILAFAFYITFIPNINYPYAVHIDEWRHIAHANTLMSEAGVNIIDPFTGEQSAEWWISVLEVGYHLPLGIFHELSGISWMDIARYMPSVIFMVTVLSVYIFARRMGFGWEAAFFTCLIPTTVGILGPGFLVPVAMGLNFAVIILFLAFNFRTTFSYLLIFMLLLYLVFLHATSAFLVVIILFPLILISYWKDGRHGLILTLTMAIPILISLPWTYDLLIQKLSSLFVRQDLPAYHDKLKLFTEYGYLPIIIGLLGTFYLSFKGNWKNYSLICGLLILVFILMAFYSLHYGFSDIYFRDLLFTMLLMGIIAGAGLMMIRKLEVPWLKNITIRKFHVIPVLGILLCLITIGATLATTLPDRQNEGYYHMIDDDDYAAFTWIRDNIDADYDKAILDPWKATAFTAITEKHVYSRIHVSAQDTDYIAYDFIRGGSSNTTFLNENDIAIVYTRIYDGQQNNEYIISNPDLIEVRKNIYLLER